MKIKDQIRARRKQLGISLVQVSAKLGVTDQAVRHWESGREYVFVGSGSLCDDLRLGLHAVATLAKKMLP